MSRMKRYAYMAVLLVTVLVMTPFIVKEVWTSHAQENALAKQQKDAGKSASAQAGSVDTKKQEIKKVQKQNGKETSEPEAADVAQNEEQKTEPPVEDTELVVEEAAAVTEPPKKEFVVSDASYFDDALFIGDSRTVGISEYGTLKNADYYADTGMAVDKLYKKPAAIPGGVDFETMLTKKQYGKIYIMLGINEIGNNREKTLAKYQELVNYVRQRQPGAIIYMQANLHVTQSRSERDAVVNNAAINEFNSCLAQMADGETIFYLDANEIFDDANGNLNEEYSSDDTHVLAKYYQNWTGWLCEKTIVP